MSSAVGDLLVERLYHENWVNVGSNSRGQQLLTLPAN
jgi:hypothetical protein